MNWTELFNVGLTDMSTLKDDVNNKVFLITTFHPTDHQLKDTIYHNWDLWDRSTVPPPNEGFTLHEKKLMM